jgi:hypothetical protein
VGEGVRAQDCIRLRHDLGDLLLGGVELALHGLDLGVLGPDLYRLIADLGVFCLEQARYLPLVQKDLSALSF